MKTIIDKSEKKVFGNKLFLATSKKLTKREITLLKMETSFLEVVITDLKALNIHDVSDCQFEKYGEFCIECDRKGISPLKYNDYLKIG